MPRAKKLKIIAAAVAVIVVLIVIYQNTAMVQAHVLLMTVSMPLALFLIITLLVGYAAGLLSASGIFKRGKSKKVKL